MEIENLVAIEPVARGVDLNLDLRAVSRPQLPRVFERRDRIAFAEMHQHRATRPLGNVGTDLGGVVADRASDIVKLGGGAPRHCPAPAVSERRDLSAAADVLLRRSDVGEDVVPWYPAAQVAPDRRIVFRVAELDARADAIEQRRRHDMISACRETVADAADVRGDAVDLLQQHEPAARWPIRPRLVGGQAMPVAREQRNCCTRHAVIRMPRTGLASASPLSYGYGKIPPIFENMLTSGNSECDGFGSDILAEKGRARRRTPDREPCARRAARHSPARTDLALKMENAAFPLTSSLPVAIVGAGPVGLTTALALAYHRIPFVLFEANADLSTETKAGTTLTRTLEIWQRFGAASKVLTRAMRVDEIGDIERASNRSRDSVKLHFLRDETRFPFVINLPQHEMEPALRDCLKESKYGAIQYRHRLTSFTQAPDKVSLEFETPEGKKSIDACYLLACDGGRSTVRDQLGVTVEGRSLPERYSLVDLKVDLDVENPRDYPYLAYFSDAKEWMILVRQPDCWRFLYPVDEGQKEYTIDELREKAVHFIGDVSNVEVLGTNLFKIHHRVAGKWRHGRVLLLGDAAHLITPMWALGLNTGILDANSVAWRMAWVLRGWADDGLFDGYECERSRSPNAAPAKWPRRRGHIC